MSQSVVIPDHSQCLAVVKLATLCRTAPSARFSCAHPRSVAAAQDKGSLPDAARKSATLCEVMTWHHSIESEVRIASISVTQLACHTGTMALDLYILHKSWSLYKPTKSSLRVQDSS